MPVKCSKHYPTRQQIQCEAKTWLGTPFHHQASIKGVGCDCAGFVKGVATNLGYITKKIRANYGREPANGALEKLLATLIIPTNKPEPGDIILFKFLNEPQHLGILLADNVVIHAYSGEGKVIMHRLDKKWLNRVVGHYALPGVN